MKFNKIVAFTCFLLCSFAVYPQSNIKVSGVVTDKMGESIIGASIYAKSDPGTGVITDYNGRYELSVPPGSILVFSYIGYSVQEVQLGTNNNQFINVVLEESAQELEEVSIVGYGIQRKVSVVGSIATVKPDELKVGGVTSVTNNLAGRIAGLIGVQSSGEPGSDVSEFWIRGISTFGGGSSALVLIDGIDRGTAGLNDLAPEDIESFSVLKDATATAIYGARGANGVILINTRRGEEGKITISANFKSSMETLPRLPEYLNAYDYAKLANEARVVRGGLPVYSPEIFDIIQYGMDPDLYPDVNWQKEILRDKAYAMQGNINISGGGKLARYYMSMSYRTNDAIYKQEGMKKYHSDVRRNQYSFRSNIDVDATPTTKVSLLLSAKLIDQNRPGLSSTTQIWNAVSNITPMTVPVRYSNGMFPSYGEGNSTSPTVLLNETGYRSDRSNTIETLLTIEQNLGGLVNGLKATGSISFDNDNNHAQARYKMPDLYMAVDRNWQTGELLTTKTVVASPMSYASSSYGRRTIYIEGRMNYDQIINDRHRVGALFLYQQKDYQRTDVYNELSSIPRRHQGIAGRFTYSLDDIYFVESNFGYNGSENFPKGQRFGFFPSVALGYVVSNYEFVKDRLPVINTLKFRYSFGLVGNDKIERDGSEVRFPYLTRVNMNATGYYFGDIPGYYYGVTDSELGSTGLVWESAKKHNWGIDLTLLDNALNITVDAFLDKRDNIFMERNTLPGTLGVRSTIWGNVGRMKSWGTDGTASYTKKFGDWTIEARGNFTFTRDKIIDYDEVIPRYPYLARKGNPYGITRGLIALGLFKDEDDVKNSPTQFGKVMPGDIKYQDVNGDGVIDSYDVVPIGNARIPRIQYGFATSAQWKGFDFNVFFRGSGKSDFFFGGTGFYPFVGEKLGNVLTIVNDQKNRWTPASYSGDPATENPNARFPRLTYGNNPNNNRNSTFWLADASFLRLKTMEIGYTFPKAWSQKMAMNNLRISIIGDNLYVWDKVKFWDPEQASDNGAVYPLTRSYTAVLQMSF
ncbi:TonB-dependent receptor [Proteiniphilum sp.]|uniref:SusC/RagA family TonB-linked outer membrane protein n=1 Tax=Proteiniphilum sp. TaxID=1926877 RepID=UPI002B220B4E|nr:TonB-dependent receptor [Proteiniphilum sp.]MEA4919111.1 TonB-dependent receptor [Proteiniphilum sp.]